MFERYYYCQIILLFRLFSWDQVPCNTKRIATSKYSHGKTVKLQDFSIFSPFQLHHCIVLFFLSHNNEPRYEATDSCFWGSCLEYRPVKRLSWLSVWLVSVTSSSIGAELWARTLSFPCIIDEDPHIFFDTTWHLRLMSSLISLRIK
jgi:hypothetical protein